MPGCDTNLVTRDDLYKAKRQTQFIDDVATGGPLETVTNPDTGVVVPTLQKVLADIGFTRSAPWDTDPLVTEALQVIPYNNQLFLPNTLPYQVDSTTHPDPNALVPSELRDVSSFVNEQQVIDILSTNINTIDATSKGGNTPRKIEDHLSDVTNVLDFGADPTNTNNSTSSFDLAKAAGEYLMLPSGVFLGQLDLSDNTGSNSWSVEGKGFGGRGIRYPDEYNTGATEIRNNGTALNLANTTDVIYSGREIRNIILTSDTSDPAVSISYNHYTEFSNFRIIGDTGSALVAKDAWLNKFNNGYFQADVNGVHIVGSCHQTYFERCRFFGGSNGLLIENNGTTADGNLSVQVNTCDFEFMGGNGINNAGAFKLLVTAPYMEKVSGYSLITSDGASTEVKGGSIGVGSQSDAALLAETGSSINLEGVRFYQEAGSVPLQKLISNSTEGRISIKDSEISLSTSDAIWTGKPLGFGPFQRSLNRRSREAWSGSGLDKSNLTGNAARYVCNSSQAFAEASCFNDKDNFIFSDDLRLIIIYSSNRDFYLRTQASAGGGGPISGEILLPNTGGVIKTYVLLSPVSYTSLNSAMTSIYANSVNVGDFIEIHDVGLYNSESFRPYSDLYLPNY